MVDEHLGLGAIRENPICRSPVNVAYDPQPASMLAKRANDLVSYDSHLAPIGFRDVD